MLQQLRNRIVSPSELHAVVSSRIRKTQDLNAYVYINQENSEIQALDSTKRYEKNAQRTLEGLPIAIKDNFCTAGIKTTCASKMLENFVPTYTATVVQKLLDAGAYVTGKTNLDEFGMGSGTTESIFGPTKNIWGSSPLMEKSDEDFRIAGGSSGGSAVAVAGGTCFAALGSDTGGSTRNPASYTGTVGFKPSYGTLSRHGLIPLVNSMDVPGILTRKVEDARLVFDTIKGWDEKDSTTVKLGVLRSQMQLKSVKGLKVGIPREYHCPGLSSEVVQAWNEIADLLEHNGAHVTQVSLPHTQYSIACYSVLNPCEVASNMARYDGLRYGFRASGEFGKKGVDSLYAATRSNALNDIVRGRILAGNYFLLKRNYEKYFEQAMRVRRLITNDYLKVWNKGIQVLLTPVTLSVAPRFSEFKSLDPRAQSALQDFCTQPANMAGIPAISFPVKLSAENLPISLQLMSKWRDDYTLLDTAEWIQDQVNFKHIVE